MHPNPAFRAAEDTLNLTFARTRAFGALSINGETGPLLAHVPFLLSEDGARVDLHLVRSNPIWRALENPLDAVIAVSGADGYVSPDWYETPDMVPTWNYVAVHLRGRLERLDHSALHDLLVRQAAAYEARIDGKAPWTFDKMTPDAITRMQRMIAPVRLYVETVDGTWKLGQNKDETARLAASAQMHTGFGQELAEIARLMAHPPA